MKQVFAIFAIVFACLFSPVKASLISINNVGSGFLGSSAAETTFLNTMTTAEAIWEADSGTTIDVGVEAWDDQVSGYEMDKLNDPAQPTLITSANFNDQTVLNFNSAASQAMDASPFADVTGNDQMTIFLVVEHDTAATTAVLAEVTNGSTSQALCQILTVSSGTIRARCKNSAGNSVSANWTVATNFTATTLTLVYDGTSGANIKLYECNTQRATATHATGGFGTTSTRAWAMQQADSSLNADGKIAAYIVDDNAWGTSTLADAVAIANAKYGVCE